jgi:hypothetical protein
MCALGQKQTFCDAEAMSALPPRADMCGAVKDVRFGPEADIRQAFILSLEALTALRHTCSVNCELSRLPNMENIFCSFNGARMDGH